MIIIYTPFKTSSSSLQTTLNKNKIKNIKYHNKCYQCPILDYNLDLKYFINDENNKIIISLVRKPTDLYLSAYFQDIDCDSYEYCYSTNRDEILKTSVDELLSFFYTFNWKKYVYLNIEELVSEYEDLISKNEIKLIESTNYYKKYISKNNQQLYLVDSKQIERFLKEIFNLKIINENQSDEKWYKTKYLECKNKLSSDYYKKYSNQDSFYNKLFI